MVFIRTHTVKTETQAKHSNYYKRESWSSHAIYKKFGKPSAEISLYSIRLFYSSLTIISIFKFLI